MAVAWVTGKRLLYSWGGNVVCYGRSMMKPVMMRVFSKDLDNILNWEQKAISVSSHNGDTEHVRAVKSILKESELGLMQTPHALPMIQFVSNDVGQDAGIILALENMLQSYEVVS